MEKKDAMMQKENAMMEKGSMMDSSYTGKVLAGTESTKYLDFTKADYDKALKDKKKILLYFYASWCPTCKKEQPETFAAFNELNDPDLIGFRVNFRDSDTDADEEQLAKDLGVSYQHTKVILKEGQRVLKAPDSWGKQRYLDELAKV
jgi:thiol-disulfide isomerase/thioredoxin